MSNLDEVFDSDLATMGMRLEPDERSDDVVRAIAEYLHEQPHIVSRFFKFPGAPQQAIHNFYRTIKLVSVKRSTLLCRQGEIGTCFYIIKRGSAEVLHHPVRMVSAVHARVGVGGSTGAIVVSSSDRSRLGCRVGVLTPGMVFGEVSACGEERDSSVVALGSLAAAPDMDTGGWQSASDSLHLASAHAVGETELFQVDLNAYSRCAPATLVKAEAALRRRVERLMVLDLFSDWPTQELGFFARWMTELALPEAGEVLYAEGEPVDTVFFVLEGSVGLQCQHPTTPHAVLHLHHVNAPSFCGEDEVMNGIEERVHTCVSVTAHTTVAMLPARVFQVLITSQFPARMYKSAEKLRRLREARTDWYDIRMSLGDSAAVPFGFLDHSQSKLLPNELHEGVVTRERKITNLFQRVLSGEDGPLATARRTARGMQAGAGGAGAGASGSRGAAPSTPRRPLSARRASMATMLLGSAPPPAAQPAASRSLPRTSSAQKLQDGTRDDDPPELSSYDRFYSGTYHAPSTPDPDAAVLRPQAAPPVPPLNLIGTPRVGGEDRPASPMDWNKPKMSEAEFERQRTKETVAVELTAVMKAVNQFKRLLGRRRARQARKKAQQAAQAHHSPHASPHGARDSPVSGTLERAPGGGGRSGDGTRVRRARGHHRRRSSDDRRRTSGTTTLPAAAGSAAKASYSRSSSLGDSNNSGGQSAKELARTGSMGSALSAASGPKVGSGFGLRQTKSMHAMPSRRSSRVPRRLPSIEDNQPPLVAVPVDSPTSIGSGGSGGTPTSHGSASSRTAGRRRSSSRALARASANKPEPLHRQLLRARASVAGQSPTASDGSPLPATPERRASGTAFRRINDTDRALSPAAMRARNASARRRSSGGSEESARAAAAAVARTDDMRRSWSPARGGPARDLGQSTPEDERRRASLAVALGSEAQAQLRNPTPGSPASKLPERARRASFASMQRRSSVSSLSEANLP